MAKDFREYDRDLQHLKEMMSDVDQSPVPSCAVCGATERTMTNNLIAVSQHVESRGPQSGVEGGFYTICEECAPVCGKCKLPRLTRTVRDFAQAVGGKIVDSAACRHFHFSSLWGG